MNISDDDLKLLNEYAADSLWSDPPPFKTVSGDLLLMMTDELIRRRAADVLAE